MEFSLYLHWPQTERSALSGALCQVGILRARYSATTLRLPQNKGDKDPLIGPEQGDDVVGRPPDDELEIDAVVGKDQ
jgi:hypothetical protein